MDEMTTTRTIETITAEIVALKADAGKAIIGIGERLIEAKEQLGHGEWLPWLTEKVDFSERTAQNFMRLAREWRNPQTLADLGASKALTLLALPEPEREEFIEEHDVPNMSTRELEQAIRERDEARKAAEEARMLADAMKARAVAAEDKADSLRDDCDDLRDEINALKKAPKEVYRDEAAIQKAAEDAKKDAAAEWEARLKAAEGSEKVWKEKLKAAEEKLAKAQEQVKATEGSAKLQAAEEAAEKKAAKELADAKQELEDARAEAEDLRTRLEAEQAARKNSAIAGDSDLAMAQEYAAQIVASANKLRGLLIKAQNAQDEKKAELVRKAILTLAEKLQEVAK